MVCFKQHCEIQKYKYDNNDAKLNETIKLKNESAGYMTIENPRGMATDSSKKIYITDSHSHKLFKFNEQGQLIKCTRGCGNNFGDLHEPKGIVIIKDCVFVCDLLNQRVQCFDQDLNPLYVIYILQSICPFHITCGREINPTRLYISGTNIIYICELSGDLTKPTELTAKERCSMSKYSKNKCIYPFQRIGGLAVKESDNDKVQLFVSETFDNSVLVLNVDIPPEKNECTPELSSKYPTTGMHKPTERESFKIVVATDSPMELEGERQGTKNATATGSPTEPQERKLKKPHPIAVDGNILIVSTDEKEKVKIFDLSNE